MGIKYLTERRDSLSGWSRKVAVDGVVYWVEVRRGKAVRIPYKPRGRNIGYWWIGYVRTEQGQQVWRGLTIKSIGARGLLLDAGVLGAPKENP